MADKPILFNNSKGIPFKFLLETIGKSKRNEEKGHLQVETSPILTPLQQNKQSHHKNTLYVGNPDSNVSIEDIYELFGLKSTAYLC